MYATPTSGMVRADCKSSRNDANIYASSRELAATSTLYIQYCNSERLVHGLVVGKLLRHCTMVVQLCAQNRSAQK